MRLMGIRRRSVRRALQLGNSDLKLELGSGPRRRSGFVTVDLMPGADLQLDVRESLPFRAGSAVEMYMEHFFEHLSYPGDADALLRECHRVLSPQGVLSIGVPDAAMILDDYCRQDLAKFEMLRSTVHPDWCTTPMHHVNYLFRQQGEHHYAYDFQTLSVVLEAAGFINIRRRDWDPHRDSESRRWGTLYVDCIRP